MEYRSAPDSLKGPGYTNELLAKYKISSALQKAQQLSKPSSIISGKSTILGQYAQDSMAHATSAPRAEHGAPTSSIPLRSTSTPRPARAGSSAPQPLSSGSILGQYSSLYIPSNPTTTPARGVAASPARLRPAYGTNSTSTSTSNAAYAGSSASYKASSAPYGVAKATGGSAPDSSTSYRTSDALYGLAKATRGSALSSSSSSSVGGVLPGARISYTSSLSQDSTLGSRSNSADGSRRSSSSTAGKLPSAPVDRLVNYSREVGTGGQGDYISSIGGISSLSSRVQRREWDEQGGSLQGQEAGRCQEEAPSTERGSLAQSAGGGRGVTEASDIDSFYRLSGLGRSSSGKGRTSTSISYTSSSISYTSPATPDSASAINGAFIPPHRLPPTSSLSASEPSIQALNQDQILANPSGSRDAPSAAFYSTTPPSSSPDAPHLNPLYNPQPAAKPASTFEAGSLGHAPSTSDRTGAAAVGGGSASTSHGGLLQRALSNANAAASHPLHESTLPSQTLPPSPTPQWDETRQAVPISRVANTSTQGSSSLYQTDSGCTASTDDTFTSCLSDTATRGSSGLYHTGYGSTASTAGTFTSLHGKALQHLASTSSTTSDSTFDSPLMSGPSLAVSAHQSSSRPQNALFSTTSSVSSMDSSLSSSFNSRSSSRTTSSSDPSSPPAAPPTTTPQPALQALPPLPQAGGCVGLQNLGNTCFMNSILQSLNTIPELVQWFRHEKMWKPRASVAPAFSELLLQMWAARPGKGAVNPGRFLDCMARYDSRWGEGRQHDSQELLHSLLAALQADCNRVVGKPCYRELKGEGSVVQQAEEAEAYARSWHDSAIDDLFGGLLQSTLQCHKCMRQSHCFDPFFDLSLPIPSKPSISVQDCLKAFVELEKLGTSEAFKCQGCNTIQAATKKLQVWRPPRCLVLTLKRFSQSSQSKLLSRFAYGSKNSARVHISTQPLDLTPYCNPDGAVAQPGTPRPVYALTAVSRHSGSLAGGHYTALGRHARDGCWYYFNDSEVSEEQAPDGLSSASYVLFYQLLSMPSSSL